MPKTNVLFNISGSEGEQQFAEKTGLVQNRQGVGCYSKGQGHFVVPDFVVLDEDGNRCLIEYKHGNKLNTDGARGGREAAERAKQRYIDNDFNGNYKQRLANAHAHYGWNHSIYKMIEMRKIYDRVIVVDPELNHHSTCQEYQRKVIQKGKINGVEFMTITEFEAAFDDCLDVGVSHIYKLTEIEVIETSSPVSEVELIGLDTLELP